MVQADKVLEFDKMKEKWIELALTEWAKEKIKDTVPSMSENELIARQRETSEARELLEKSRNPPLVSLSGIRECIQKAAKGDCLSISQLEDMEKSLVAVMRLKNYLSRCKQWEISLAYYDEKLDCLDNLKDTISMQIRNGRIDDNASKDLKSLRDDIERNEKCMREKVDAVIRANKESLSDHFSTLRNGHICIPVKKEYKYKIKGNVIDKSSTGGTLFIEPSSVGKYYETLQLLRIHEENEEYRILYSLSAMVADYEEILEQNISMIEKLDFIFSKGKLSLEYDGTEPKINTERYIRIEDGRHPLMSPSECVPLQFEIGKSFDGVVITGPNTGGKTVTIKTVALNCMMAQCGLHVACKKAEICMNSNFLCDIGDGQNISENLSTFSAHIVNVLEILKKVNRDSLVVIGEAGESCAFYIAGKMGMPEEMLKTAMKAAYGKEEISENLKQVVSKNHLEKRRVSGIQKRKRRNEAAQKALEFQLGDSVLVYPDKKIGIICKTANEKGVLRVQMADKKIWVNRKRIKLHVAAEKLYPDDYDFSIIFDSVKNRKLRHQMDRGKIIEEQITIDE